jgi:hypothetical protein
MIKPGDKVRLNAEGIANAKTYPANDPCLWIPGVIYTAISVMDEPRDGGMEEPIVSCGLNERVWARFLEIVYEPLRHEGNIWNAEVNEQ